MEIETFKEKIFESLNSYNEEIEILKKDMENFSKTTEKIQKELDLKNNEYVEVNL